MPDPQPVYGKRIAHIDQQLANTGNDNYWEIRGITSNDGTGIAIRVRRDADGNNFASVEPK